MQTEPTTAHCRQYRIDLHFMLINPIHPVGMRHAPNLESPIKTETLIGEQLYFTAAPGYSTLVTF